MTSNIGSSYLLDSIGGEGVITEAAREKVLQELRMKFRPEFLNRVDDTVMFKPLGQEDIRRIIDLLLKDLDKRLEAKKITLELSDAARNYIAGKGYDPVYGARPLRRYLQREVETRLARAILKDEAPEGSTVTFDFRDGDLVIRTNKAKASR